MDAMERMDESLKNAWLACASSYRATTDEMSESYESYNQSIVESYERANERFSYAEQDRRMVEAYEDASSSDDILDKY